MLSTFNIPTTAPVTAPVDRNSKSQLTDRELEILVLLAEGRENSEIARALYISTNTVKSHLRKIYRKLGVDSRVKTALLAIRMGLI